MSVNVDSKNSVDEQKKKKKSSHFKKIIAFNILFILIDFLLLLILKHEFYIIRGDGPVGFEEMVVKALVFFFCLGLFILDFIILAVAIYKKKQGPFAIAIKAFIFAMLVFFALIVIELACSDDKGYCQNKRIVIPENSIFSTRING